MEKKALIFNKGINTDVSPLKQPEGTYRMALNAVGETRDGNLTDLNSEEGNKPCSQLQEGDIIKASVLLDDNSRVLFIYNKPTNISYIARETRDCQLEILIVSSCFKWDSYNRIDVEFRIFKGCERVLYFTDSVNPMMVINIDSLIDYVPVEVIENDDIITNDEKVLYTQENDLWDCKKLLFDREIIYPTIEFVELTNSGGSIEVGTYQFSIRYLDGDLNPTNWLNITNPIPVVFQNTNSNYFTISGGIAGDGSNIAATGQAALPPSSKSIILDISNIDRSFEFYQIAVIQTSASIGFSSEVYIKEVVPIASDTDTFVFVGKDSTQDIAGSINELTVQRESIGVVNHLAQIDNTLLLAGVKSKPYDWSIFQQKASQIGSKYVIETVKKSEYNESMKSGEYYYNNRSYMRDEIYAFAIVYVFKDGTESPAFHIPGRPLNYDPVNKVALSANWDDAAITAGGPDYDFLPEDLRDNHPKWMSHNTAHKFNNGTGLMSYYESETTYPRIRNCAGESIWGKDIQGNFLEGQPIRHHKFPDSLVEKYQDLANVYPIGVEFFDIVIPEEYADDIQGYYIVRDQRKDVNKTILDKGILDNAIRWTKGANVRYTYLRNSTALDNSLDTIDNEFDMFIFHSPKVYYTREFFRGDHFKIEGVWQFFAAYNESLPLLLTNNPAISPSDNMETVAYFFWDHFGEFVPTVELSGNRHRVILDSKYCDAIPENIRPDTNVNPVTVLVDNTRFNNNLASTHLHVSKLADALEPSVFDPNLGENPAEDDRFYYAAYKVYRQVYNNLFSLRYIRTTSNIHTGTSALVYGGDTFISLLEVSLSDFDRSRAFITAYVESEINSDLRHNPGEDACSQNFTGQYFDTVGVDFNPTRVWWNAYIPNEESIPNIDAAILSFDVDSYLFRHKALNHPDFVDTGIGYPDYVCKQPYAYNPDFSKINNERQYFAIPINFNYCSKCLNELPYIIYFSEKSFQEERVDNYRVILANNYTTIMADSGPISNMFVDRDRLYVHANKSLWALQTKPNELSTTENTIFVGTGDFLSIPPRKLITTEYGYGGSNQKWSTVTTEAGTFFCDTNLGKVFLLEKGLQEINMQGLNSFFENNMTLFFLDDYYSLTGSSYSSVDAIDDNSVGIIATYDPRYKRYILHKKDYKFTTKGKQVFAGEYIDNNVTSPLDKAIYYNTTEKSFYEIDNTTSTLNRINLYNSEYFINKSFTLSYYVMLKAWISYHSYMPNIMYNDADTFYSYATGDPRTYSHNSNVYNTYYGTKFPVILEYVDNNNPSIDKIFSSIYYISEVTREDSINNYPVEVSDVTFDELYMFTRDQITSTNTIINKNTQPYLSISDDKTISIAARVDNAYRVSKNMRDIAINRNSLPIITSNWDDTNYSSFFNVDGLGNGYMDYVPNEQARDIDKSVYERARIKDKYVRIRLTFNPNDNLRMSLQLSSIFLLPKNR